VARHLGRQLNLVVDLDDDGQKLVGGPGTGGGRGLHHLQRLHIFIFILLLLLLLVLLLCGECLAPVGQQSPPGCCITELQDSVTSAKGKGRSQILFVEDWMVG
jgi:hypothetical protein